MFEIKKLKNDSRDLAQLKIASSWLLFFRWKMTFKTSLKFNDEYGDF